MDEMSPSLRERNTAQACRDVRQALITACGIAALYGLAPLAIGAAFGLNANPDIAGKAVTEIVDGAQRTANQHLDRSEAYRDFKHIHGWRDEKAAAFKSAFACHVVRCDGKRC